MSFPKESFNEASKWMQRYSKSFSDQNDLSPDECKSRAESIIHDAGYSTPSCPGGTYRNVYTGEDTVVKLAVGGKGIDENAAEIRNCTRISEAHIPDIVGEGFCDGDKYIAEVYEHEVGSNRWLVMEKAEVKPNNVSNKMANRVQNAFSKAGIHIEEISPVNMGTIDGVPVVFDYAGT